MTSVIQHNLIQTGYSIIFTGPAQTLGEGIYTEDGNFDDHLRTLPIMMGKGHEQGNCKKYKWSLNIREIMLIN